MCTSSDMKYMNWQLEYFTQSYLKLPMQVYSPMSHGK